MSARIIVKSVGGSYTEVSGTKIKVVWCVVAVIFHD